MTAGASPFGPALLAALCTWVALLLPGVRGVVARRLAALPGRPARAPLDRSALRRPRTATAHHPVAGATADRHRPRARPAGYWPHGLAVAAVLGLVILVLGWPLGPVVGAGAGGALGWSLHRHDGSAQRRRHAVVAAELPLAADLLAAVLRAGEPVPDALAAVARGLGGPLGAELRVAADRARLGADPVETWRAVRGPPELAALGRALARSERTGAAVADVLDRCAADLRHAARARMAESCQRTTVFVVAPLGLCFLPAFALIGVVPMAAGLLSQLQLP